jgi:hypothetical protein
MQSSIRKVDVYCNTSWAHDGDMFAALTLTILALGSAGLFVVARRSNGTRIFHLDQFRPAAPLAGLLPEGRDAERAHRDLQAAQSRHETVPAGKGAPHH